MVDYNYYINVIVKYALKEKLINEYDEDYCLNLLIEFFNIDEVIKIDVGNTSIYEALEKLYELKKEEFNFQDFTSKVMNIVTPLPSSVKDKFLIYIKNNHRKATEYLYHIATKSIYINEEDLKKDIKWKYLSKYGNLDITINLSKPEKDPKQIALAKTLTNTNYPLCMLCKENLGYKGRPNYPSKTTLRYVPINLGIDKYYLQFSPYSYFYQHLIVFNKSHVPMVINQKTFEHLLEFVNMFPHYFLGSNADLPIVGGSILTHDHYQGGSKNLAMFKAKDKFQIQLSKQYSEIKATYLNWPLSVIRLRSKNMFKLSLLAEKILNSFINFTDEKNKIYAYTNNERHNTITPIVHKEDKTYVLDLTLRNNYTDEAHPLGLYHPHEEYWAIKKENIGIIEVLGLAILPRRLKDSLKIIIDDINSNVDIQSDERVKMHYSWVKDVPLNDKEHLESNLKKEIGKKYVKILECCAIFKSDKQAKDSINKIIDNID